MEKVTAVIQALSKRELQIGDPISAFAAFFGSDFPPESDDVIGKKNTWIAIDLFPNRIFKDPKHTSVGWSLWIEVGADQKVVSYFLTDQRKLTYVER
jgi:hypothetical protein